MPCRNSLVGIFLLVGLRPRGTHANYSHAILISLRLEPMLQNVHISLECISMRDDVTKKKWGFQVK